MDFQALTCPQCGGILPRQARWRTVACLFCSSLVTRADDVVPPAVFREAWERARAAISFPGPVVEFGGSSFSLLAPLGGDEHADMFLAARRHFFAELVHVKIARQDADQGRIAAEYAVLDALQSLDVAGAAYYTTRVPQPVCAGAAAASGLAALAYRRPPGFWGTLEDVCRANPGGINPRHAVWMWRRVLDLLGFLHGTGWTHGDLHPGNQLVNPALHGVLVTGWAVAERAGGHAAARARDLAQSAWTVRALLDGSEGEPGFGNDTPDEIAALLRRVCEDGTWSAKQGAAGIDAELVTAAKAAYGPPEFIAFYPVPPGS